MIRSRKIEIIRRLIRSQKLKDSGAVAQATTDLKALQAECPHPTHQHMQHRVKAQAGKYPVGTLLTWCDGCSKLLSRELPATEPPAKPFDFDAYNGIRR